MKLANLVGERFKERPSDCVIDSHALMVRGAYIKHVGNGIFSLFNTQKRISRKIEEIIREEMDAIDGQEVLFPVVIPASLWEESGRYESVGAELLRFEDRNGSKHLLGMTHEEPAVQMVREYGKSYSKYPFMIYQIQTKFRDEARPRAGLIRVREFTMKDGYSYHTSQEDLEKYYERCHKAYENIFRRAGIPDVVSVASDSGMMGGKISHEFMLLTPVGEDTIVICEKCDYKANMEAAQNIVTNSKDENSKQPELVHTPNCQTIEDVCKFLGMPTDKSCKAVIYTKEKDGKYLVLFIRGDFEVNEAKLKAVVGSDIFPAVVSEESGIIAGFTGPFDSDNLKNHTVIFDSSLKGANNISCGGNKKDYHYIGIDFDRDLGEIEFHDVAKIKEGGTCPICGKDSITIKRGIEVGNIFQLGDKYTKSMNMTYLDEKGESHHPIMGCYGIGVGRLAASVCEASNDASGPIWPISIAPWHVHICAMRVDDLEVRETADMLYETLKNDRVEVIYDDRAVTAGVMFSDADLLGVPVRVIVSPRNLKENVCEIVTRDKTIVKKVPVSDVAKEVKLLIEELFDKLKA